MSYKPPSFRNAIILSLVLLSLHWDSFAAATSNQNPSIPFSRNLFFNLSRTQRSAFAGDTLGEAPAFADFDGDKRPDVAVARLSENHYEIFVLLSTGSDVIVLSPPTQLTGFTVRACDINKDSFQDVVITSPALAHPLAVWLGDGKGRFRSADQNLFKNDFGITESSGYQSPHFIILDQDLLTESSHTVCEKITFRGSGLERNGFITCRACFCSLRNAFFSITPRSPPSVFSI